MKVHLNQISRRNVVVLDKQKGIFNNGEDNSYPQRIERIINNSVTAKSCANKLKSFLIGDGFVDQSLNDIVIYSDINGKVTLFKLLSQIAHSISRQNAASCQIQYNGNFDIVGVKQVPYRNIRFGRKDSNEYSGFIHVYDNWEKRPEVPYKITDAKKIHAYNPMPSIVESQFKKGYQGQISTLILDDEYIYPLALIDPALEDADTEAQIKSFKNGELRKGFFAKYILFHTRFNNEQEQRDFKTVFKQFESGEHNSSILTAEAEFDEETGEFLKSANFQLQKIEQNINDKIFESYEKSVANNIRKVNLNIPSILVEQQDGAMFGSSGEAMKASFDIYNSETKFIRQAIEQWFKEIFSHSDNEILKNADFAIAELTYDNEAVDTASIPLEILNTLTLNEKRNLIGFEELASSGDASLLSEKLGVGGTQSLLAIVQDTTMQRNQKAGALKVLFNLTDEQITSLIGI
jgi:disulfide oxidoreductase YuzD